LAEKKKELTKLRETLGNVKEQLDMLRNFVQKTSQTNFMMECKRRLRITDPKRYRDVAVLLRDTRTLKVAYKGKIPSMGQNDSEEFPRLIKQMRNKIKRETGDFNLSDADDDDDASSDSEDLFFGQQRKTVYTTSESTNVSNDQKVQNILSKSKTVDQLQSNSTWQCSVMPPRTMSMPFQPPIAMQQSNQCHWFRQHVPQPLSFMYPGNQGVTFAHTDIPMAMEYRSGIRTGNDMQPFSYSELSPNFDTTSTRAATDELPLLSDLETFLDLVNE
jgi:hypothetical protein